MNPSINQQNNQHSNQQDLPEQPAETHAPQGFEGHSNQQDFSNQPAQQPAQQPKKEKGIKEEGLQLKGADPMRKEKHFNIREINGALSIEPWLERGIEELAKREYCLNITVNVVKLIKDSSVARQHWIIPFETHKIAR